MLTIHIDWSDLSTDGFPAVTDLSHCLHSFCHLILFPCQVGKLSLKVLKSPITFILCSVWFNSGRLGLATGFIFYYLTFAPFHVVQALGYEKLGL